MINEPKLRDPTPEQFAVMNEALLVAGLRQHELIDVSEKLYRQLRQVIDERKQAEKLIRVSEIRYRRLFEATQDGILILDSKTKKITEANPFISEFLGYSRDELLGMELWQIGLLNDERSSHAAFEELKDKGSIRYEDLPLQTKSGIQRDVEFVSSIYREDV